jgi:hypothetical protein
LLVFHSFFSLENATSAGLFSDTLASQVIIACYGFERRTNQSLSVLAQTAIAFIIDQGSFFTAPG